VRRTLVESFTGSVRRGDVLGLVGPNGAGKSTLLKALVGQHATNSGELRLGSGIDVGYYRQDLSQVPLEKTLYEIIADLRPAWERRMEIRDDLVERLRSEEHTSELQSQSNLVCRLLLEKKNT